VQGRAARIDVERESRFARIGKTCAVPDQEPTFRLEVSMAYAELASPVEGELRREPVVDADVPCPRCGGREWLVVERRAEAHLPFTRWRALACAKCGAADGWEPAGRARPGRAGGRPDGWVEEVPGMPEHPTVDDVCRIAPFRILAPGPAPKLLSHSEFAGKLTGVTVASRGVEVTTEIRSQVLYSLPVEIPPELRARNRLESLIDNWHAILQDPRSDPARELHVAAAKRQAQARADAAPAREAIIEVDGAPVSFALVEYERSWAAVADIGDESITIASRRAPATRVALSAVFCDRPD
jgi:hypothetical protein